MRREEICEVREIVEDYVDVKSVSWRKLGSNDYSTMRLEVDEIVTGKGTVVTGVWEEKWTTVGPGLKTRLAKGNRMVRVYRKACPMRIRMRNFSEYVSYDYAEHCSQETSYYWICYRSKTRKSPRSEAGSAERPAKRPRSY